MLHISVIDLGLNNISSIIRSLSATKFEVDVSMVETYEAKHYAHLVILPGIGNFGAATDVLKANELDSFLHEQVQIGSFVTGICLGMQLLGNTSAENLDSSGLGLIEGTSRKLEARKGHPVPHVGWNSVEAQKSDLLETLRETSDFYFTHSYFFEPVDSRNILGNSNYGGKIFASAVHKENIFGFQFHPEKSGVVGEKLVRELLGKVINEI